MAIVIVEDMMTVSVTWPEPDAIRTLFAESEATYSRQPGLAEKR